MIMDMNFRTILDARGHFVQNVCRLMNPAALMRRSGKDLVERLPEAERTVANGDFRGNLQSPSFHIDQQFAPALRAFPNANLETDEFLLALRRSPDRPRPSCESSRANLLRCCETAGPMFGVAELGGVSAWK